MNLMKQPEIFGIKFLTNVCLTLQLGYLVPEEIPAFFDGELTFPIEDTTADKIEQIDEVMYALPILPEENLENFKA
jgi:hypothetical protein